MTTLARFFWSLPTGVSLLALLVYISARGACLDFEQGLLVLIFMQTFLIKFMVCFLKLLRFLISEEKLPASPGALTRSSFSSLSFLALAGKLVERSLFKVFP